MKSSSRLEEWQVLDEIRARVMAASLRKVGEETGFSAGYLSDVLLGRRAVSDKLAAAFGFSKRVETVVYYQKLEKK
jgi:hypothetical protein